MPTVEETAIKFAEDFKAQNAAGLMLYFAPEAFAGLMTMQVRLQQRAAEMLAQGKTPAPVSSYKVEPKGEQDGGQAVLISFASADGTADLMTRWREIDGAWKIAGIDVVSAMDADGKPVDLTGGSAGAS